MRFLGLNVYFATIVSKITAELKIDLVKSSAIQNNSVTLSTVIIAIIFYKAL